MWYKNIAGRFFGLVRKHACDRRTDGQNYDSQDRTSIAASRGKSHFFCSALLLNTDLDGECDQHCRRPSEVYDTHRRTKRRYTQPYNTGRVTRPCYTAVQHGSNTGDFIDPCDARCARPGNTAGLYGRHTAVCTENRVFA